MRYRNTLITSAALAAALAIGGADLALAQSGSTANPAAASTISPTDRAAQNPYVNPSAAGTQTGRPNMAAPTSPNVAQPSNLRLPDDKGMSHDEARQALERKGYREVSGLQQDRNFRWQAMAMKNGRQVHVLVDHGGNVTEQR